MAADPCATTSGGRRNAFTAGNGHHLRATSGTWEWTGKPVYRTGCLALAGRRAALGRPGDWPPWCGEARQGPLHLIHGGGLVAFCPTEGFLPGRHAGKPGRAERLWSASRDDHEPPCSTGPVISGREAPPTVRPSCSRTLPPDRFPSVPTSPHPARSPHPHPARPPAGRAAPRTDGTSGRMGPKPRT